MGLKTLLLMEYTRLDKKYTGGLEMFWTFDGR